jgi:hypothetical protein
MNIKLLTITAISASAVLFSACGGAATPTNTAKPANAAPANTTTPKTDAPANTNAAAPATTGSVIKIEDGGIQFTAPKGFKISKDGEDTAVTTEDEGVETRFSVPESGDYEMAVKDAAKELDEYISDVKMGKEEKGTVDGMELTSIKGSGKDSDGKEVQFALQILKTPKKPVLMITYAEAASLTKHAADLDGFYKSIKKM